jgi:hypothetical protein
MIVNFSHVGSRSERRATREAATPLPIGSAILA